jgi:flotillin
MDMIPFSAVAAGGGLSLFAVLTVWMVLTRRRNVGPNEALIVSGRRHRAVGPDGQPTVRGFRIVKGGGAFVWPVYEKAEVLSLEVMTIDVTTPEVYTDQGIPLRVDGVAQTKVDGTETAIATAAEQFLGRSKEEMMNVAQQTIEGHLRAILGGMTVEEIYKNRDAFAQKVQEVAAGDMANMGLRIISFTLRDIKDATGYLDALGKPRLAEVKRDATSKEAKATSEAQIAQAMAGRDAAIQGAQAKQEGDVAKLGADTKVAEATRDFQLKQAEYLATVARQKAEADLAYDLQRFKTSQLVKKEEIQVQVVERDQLIALQEKEILRRQRELEATVQKPAEAQRQAAMQAADAERYKLAAEAAGRAEAQKTEGLARAETQKAQGLAQADVVRATGDADAQAILARGQAEAEVIRLKGLAEAEAMRKKAESFAQYGSAAVTEMFVTMLPELARAVSEPLSKVGSMVVVSGEGGGASRITQEVAKVMAQLPPVVESLSGVSLEELVSRIPGLARRTADGPVPPAAAGRNVVVPPAKKE